MKILFIHVVNCLQRKDVKHPLPTTLKEQKCNRRLIWTCCLWFNWKVVDSHFLNWEHKVSLNWYLSYRTISKSHKILRHCAH